VRAALEKLKLLEASDRQIAALKQAEQINPNLVVPAPIGGVVLTRNANLGLVVNAAQELFTIADLSTVWIMASVNEKDFASVRVGSQANITAPLTRPQLEGPRHLHSTAGGPCNTHGTSAYRSRESRRVSTHRNVRRCGIYRSRSVRAIVPQSAVQSSANDNLYFLPVKNNEGSYSLRQIRLGRLQTAIILNGKKYKLSFADGLHGGLGHEWARTLRER